MTNPPAPSPTTRRSPWGVFQLGLLILGCCVLGAGFSSLARGVDYSFYRRNPKARATFDGMSSVRSGSGRATSRHCTRYYTYSLAGRSVSCYTDSPCVIVFGREPSRGELVSLAYDPGSPTRCVTEVEVFTVDYSLAFLGGLIVVGAVITVFGLRRGLDSRRTMAAG